MRWGLFRKWGRGSRVVTPLLAVVLVLMCIATVACSTSYREQDAIRGITEQRNLPSGPRADYEASMALALQEFENKRYQSAVDAVLQARTVLNNSRAFQNREEYNELISRAAFLQQAIIEQQRMEEAMASAQSGLQRREVEAQAESYLDPRSIGRWGDVEGQVPAFTVNPTDEIWVIVKPASSEHPREAATEEYPGGGAMLARIAPIAEAEADGAEDPGEAEFLALPLEHTDVRASVAGYIATVDVTQQFHNPYDQKIEAVYQFPLPQDAAVSGFVMTIGERRIHGVVREKEEAEAIYEQARSQGLRASIMTQVRPNIFEQKVANIEPGKQIDVALTYFNTLSYSDGWYSFVFPMVVGPRYNPPHTNDPVNPTPRRRGLEPPANPDPQPEAAGTEIQYLRPTQRSGHDIALTLDIDAGVAIEQSRSLTHVVQTTATGESRLSITLSPNDTLPNKDFVFAFKVAGEQMKSGLVTNVDENGKGYFSLMLYPPAGLESLDRQPMEMVFVLDCSGSMRGVPMQQSKDAVKRALRRLTPDDTFQIVRFSNSASYFGDQPVPATPEQIERAIAYLDTLEGSGGTEMIQGIKLALDFPHDPRRFRTVTFLTDGFIGNERDILAAIESSLGSARIFSFGVGISVNRYLLERMAKMGRGAAAYLLPDQSGAQIMDLYFDRISRPAMTDLTIDWGGVRVADVYPSTLPDLLVGRPVVVTGRFDPAGPGFDHVQVRGRAGSQPATIVLNAAEDAVAHDGLGKVWARHRIADLMDHSLNSDERPALESAVLTTALEHQLMSAFTAYLAVDTSEVTRGGDAQPVNQPVPVPENVDYDTTVGE